MQFCSSFSTKVIRNVPPFDHVMDGIDKDCSLALEKQTDTESCCHWLINNGSCLSLSCLLFFIFLVTWPPVFPVLLSSLLYSFPVFLSFSVSLKPKDLDSFTWVSYSNYSSTAIGWEEHHHIKFAQVQTIHQRHIYWLKYCRNVA